MMIRFYVNLNDNHCSVCYWRYSTGKKAPSYLAINMLIESYIIILKKQNKLIKNLWKMSEKQD